MVGLINAIPVANKDEYKNVGVYIEHRGDDIKRSSIEMIGIGKQLARKINEKLICIVIGDKVDGIAKEVGEYGCDIVLAAESPDLADYRTMPYAQIIGDYIAEYKPNIFLLAATRNGRDLASRIAVKERTGITADCTVLDVDENRTLLANRPTYGESTLAEILCRNHRPQMATARPGTFTPAEKEKDHKYEIVKKKVTVDKSMLGKQILKFVPKKATDLTAAKIVVAGGLGLGGPDGFKLLQELADLIGGAVGASRPPVDLGWITRDHQVGQTGQAVRPDLYIAVGISGKPQHIAGMKFSKVIVSINKDPNAEINKISDYIITEDYRKAVPALIDAIKNFGKQKVAEAQKA
ncbi:MULTISPECIES: electron transfer flavoprotein subunit alpha/FixB family protein [unclassified Thermoplasma]|uniref:electron transfer flavoprotein subunit alpha/FixB family protein n=1 Tax=unclassified Thermoplasma TaxID=2684908 RepID=UPI000D8DC8B9|nr:MULTISPECIES: electron transfer flavoprotein subunit alpha/FixB family protein [unclassified Thermoplasma]PYB68888.1 electron transfer flavoprotein subunit alpha/FixB family protein [Thermoplasma sp. Kam2015]